MREKGRSRVAFVTLGCKLNYSESSTVAREFAVNGYERVSPKSFAEIYVINTCSVTEHADKKCRAAIRRLHKQNPDAIIAVMGCYAQLKPEEILDIEGVDLVLGTNQRDELFIKVSEIEKIIEHDNSNTSLSGSFSCAVSEVETIFPAYSSDDRTRSFLKIQDGCDYYCSYCTIPLARGKSRNIPIDQIVKQAGEISLKGIKEIVLTGVNTGDFGRSTGESFLDLITELSKIKGIERYRISSLEPNLLTEEIVRFISTESKFLPHFHIPLQSGCNRILALMRRRYNRELFENRVEMIRRYLPFAFIGVDVIVGFPGESEEEFMETYRFLERIEPSFLHIFPYSKRENTPAAEFLFQINDSDKNSRVARLSALSDILHQKFVDSNVSRKEQVLFESSVKGGMMYGYTRNYIRVERPYDKSLIGEIVEVII